MKTTAEVIGILFDLTKNSSLASAITGKIRKGQRPVNSDKEDIVINCLPINNEPLQKCVANVNIYVPCFIIKENGVQTDAPDFARLETLSAMAVTAFKNVREIQDWHLEWQQQTILKDENSKSWFINIRIEFFAYNVN